MLALAALVGRILGWDGGSRGGGDEKGDDAGDLHFDCLCLMFLRNEKFVEVIEVFGLFENA